MNGVASINEAPSRRVTVLVADDHVLARDCIKQLVSDVLPDVRFLEAHDGPSLFQHALDAGDAIHVALVDLRMPGMRGGTRIIELARSFPYLPLIVVSAIVSPEIIRWVEGIPSVHAFVPKRGNADGVRLALEAAMQGRKLSFAHEGARNAAPELNPRQREIRDLLRQGLSNRRIASTLGLTEGLVKEHVVEILKTVHVIPPQRGQRSPEEE